MPIANLSPSASPIPVILVDCNRTPKPDVAVERIDLEAAAPVAGLPVKATVTLLNASTVPMQPRVELLIDSGWGGSSTATPTKIDGSLAPPKGTVPFSSDENRDSPLLLASGRPLCEQSRAKRPAWRPGET